MMKRKVMFMSDLQMAKSLTDQMPELAVFCCCSLHMFTDSNVRSLPTGIMNIYEDLYQFPPEGQLVDNPEETMTRTIVHLSVKAFALALDLVISKGDDPTDTMALAKTMRANSFNFSGKDQSNDMFRFDGQGFRTQNIGMANLANCSWQQVGLWDYDTEQFQLQGQAVWPKTGGVPPRDFVECKPGESKVMRNGILQCELCGIGFASAPQVLATGDDCPCIDTNGVQSVTRFGKQFIQSTHLNGTVQHYYPVDYGTKACRAWDATLPPDCADTTGLVKLDAPAWCEHKWCYVDPTRCRHTDVKKTAFFPGVQLWYSYDKCGSVDVFTIDKALPPDGCTLCSPGISKNKYI